MNNTVVSFLDELYAAVVINYAYAEIDGFKVNRDLMTGSIYYENSSIPDVRIYATPMFMSYSAGEDKGDFADICVSVVVGDDNVDYVVKSSMDGNFFSADLNQRQQNYRAYYASLVGILKTVGALQILINERID